jgi:lysine-N-methylase
VSDAPPPTALTARYLRRFVCRGASCEDTCCQTWQIPVDEQQHQRLRGMVAAADLAAAVERNGSGALHLKLLPDGTCAFLAPDRLCSLQARHGEPALPQVCSTYPRDIVRRDDNEWEVWASVSCPEIARLCLLAPDALELEEAPADITSRWVTTRAEASGSAYAQPFIDMEIRTTALRVLSLRQHPMRTRLFLLAFLGRETSAFFHKDAAAVDAAQLRATLAAVTEPATIAHWERELAAMPAPRGLTGNLVGQLADARATLQASSFHHLVDAALGSYRAGEVVADPLGLRIDPVALWAAYAERRAAWQADWAARIDLAFENYAKNFWLRESYTRSVDLLAHARRLLVRVAVLRFLLFSHPSLVAARTLSDPAAQGEALDRAMVEVFYKVARAVEHQSNFLDRIASTVVRDGLQTFAHSTFLVLV